jgi:hypothetical protein
MSELDETGAAEFRAAVARCLDDLTAGRLVCATILFIEAPEPIDETIATDGITVRDSYLHGRAAGLALRVMAGAMAHSCADILDSAMMIDEIAERQRLAASTHAPPKGRQ